jgi:AraC-like DNA-binding protein
MNKARLITAVETEFPLIERKNIRRPFFLWHYHRVIEIFIALDGSGHYVVGDAVGEFHPRDLFVVGPGVPHSFHILPGSAHCKPIRIIVVSLMEAHEAVAAFLRYAPGNQWINDARYGFKIQARFSSQALKAIQAMNNRRTPDDLAALLTMLRTLAISRHRKRLSRSTAGPLPEKEAGRLNKIYQYIHTRLNEQIRLSELARTAGMSVPTLCRVFKRTAGKTVVRYIQECRISQVCRQLVESDRSIAEIAYASGFNTLPHFNRVFHALKGISPLHYRRSVLQR